MQTLGHYTEIELIKRAIKNNRLSSTYIFSGKTGIGKKLFAMNLAKSLFCENQTEAFTIECECKACRMVDNGSYPDLYLFSKLNENIKIDDIRVLIKNMSMTACIGKWKVVIIDDAELLSATKQDEAANALLKTLEEPTDNTLFFLITNRYDEILPTIRSRALHMRFTPLKDSEVTEILTKLRPDVGYLDTAVSLSLGSVSRALDILDSRLPNLTQSLRSRDFVRFATDVRAIPDNAKLSLSIANTYPFILEKYKSESRKEILDLAYYMLDILKRLNYNVNSELIKADFTSKIIEVFSEAV